MRIFTLVPIVCLFVGCQMGDPPQPPVPPPPEDISTWTVPELVHPPAKRTPVPVLAEAPPGKAETVQSFEPGTTYTVSVAVGTPLDIVLEQGEQVRNIITGDRTPQEEGHKPAWDVKEGKSGDGELLRPHIFVTVSEAGLSQGVTVTTTRRSYYLALRSVKQAPARVLRWTYRTAPASPSPAEDKPALLPHPETPMRYHVGYQVKAKGRPPDWMPRQVLDDGKKTYLVYPEVTLFDTVPLVRLIGPQGPQVVNSRQYLNVVIVDQLIARAELRVGIGEQAETVLITRGALRTIACPGDTDCPRWPQAAGQLAGR
jgi:type IV secretion system protein VirB9